MITSHGRGGAGNFADVSMLQKLSQKDLETPLLKTSVVTTGRGGSGNMLKNDNPTETRLRQDVEPVARRPSSGAVHYGRGGAANVFRPGSEEATAAAAAKKKSFDNAIDDDDDSSGSHRQNGRRRSSELAAKGKAFFQNLAGKKA